MHIAAGLGSCEAMEALTHGTNDEELPSRLAYLAIWRAHFCSVVRVFLFYLSSTELAGDGEFLELLNVSHEKSSWLVDMCTYISIL